MNVASAKDAFALQNVSSFGHYSVAVHGSPYGGSMTRGGAIPATYTQHHSHAAAAAPMFQLAQNANGYGQPAAAAGGLAPHIPGYR